MTAAYTFDVFSSLDGFGAHDGDWGGYWGKQGPLDWPDATVVSGDPVDVVTRLKEESGVPLRSHGSLTLNRALLAAGLVDRVQVTLFPVITGKLLESRTLDGHTQKLVYRPTRHG